MRLIALLLTLFLFSSFSYFNISTMPDCQVEQIFKWVQAKHLMWRLTNPYVIITGKRPILPGQSSDIIGQLPDGDYYSGLYTPRDKTIEYVEGDATVLAHEVAHAFGASEKEATKISDEFHQKFIFKRCIDRSS